MTQLSIKGSKIPNQNHSCLFLLFNLGLSDVISFKYSLRSVYKLYQTVRLHKKRISYDVLKFLCSHSSVDNKVTFYHLKTCKHRMFKVQTFLTVFL